MFGSIATTTTLRSSREAKALQLLVGAPRDDDEDPNLEYADSEKIDTRHRTGLIQLIIILQKYYLVLCFDDFPSTNYL